MWKHHNSIRLEGELIDFKSHWASSLVICADFACTSVSNCEIRCRSCSCSYCQNSLGNTMVTVLFTWRPGMVEILKPARNKLVCEAGCWLSMLQRNGQILTNRPQKQTFQEWFNRNWHQLTSVSRLRLFVGVTVWILGSALKNSLLLHIDLHLLAKTTHESPKTYLFAVGIASLIYFANLFASSKWNSITMHHNTIIYI